MKETIEKTYLIALLILCFPIGIFFLFRAALPKAEKIRLALIGLLTGIGLLSAVFLFHEKKREHKALYAAVTREVLTVGQSGGLCVTDGNGYCDRFTVTADPAILEIEGGVYTALAPGVCEISVSGGNDLQDTVTVIVEDGEAHLSTVFISVSGKRYHKSASHAGNKSFPVSEEDALSSGKTPCNSCYSQKKDAP